ncbi:MAG TPA: fused MFS/spermidine synthase [Thermoanaerobaculia bacterium]|nr:fused MFS/spermidine synthase [Thermoanaerobaculia bacterium]
MNRSRALKALLIIIFFLSGLGALFYQVVWLKYLGLVFGNTVYAAATIIAIYLAGLGIGGFVFARFLQRPDPLVLYAILEALIGTLGALSPSAFSLLDSAYIASFRLFEGAPFLLAVSRGAVASLFLLPPTILMGGTLPLLIRCFTGGRKDGGTSVSVLYAANTFGATAGVGLAGFLTIPAIGLLATTFLAVILNFALAVVSAVVAFSSGKRAAPVAGSEEREPDELPPIALRGGAPVVLAASFLMGLTSIADEVFWSRILVLHLGSSVYAYSLMLFCFLLGLASGSALIARFIERVALPRLLGMLEIALAVVLVMQIHLFGRFADILESSARTFGIETDWQRMLAYLSSTLVALFIPTLLMGATFPVAVKLYSRARDERESRSVGSVYLANTIGSIAGSLAAGFLLVRAIGSQNGLFTMAAINLGVGAVFWLQPDRRASRFALPGFAALLVIASFAAARPDQVVLSAGIFADSKAPILVFREDVTATVTLRRVAPERLSLELNGVNVAGTAPDLRGSQKLQGHLPLLIHPAAKSVLHIGFGSGGTAWAVSQHPVREITIAEISPEVLDVSDRHLRSENHGVLDDRRVRVVVNDGRNFVLATPERFDVILSDSIHPRYAGNSTLYTRDYFALCRERLNPGGIVSMWLPTYSLTSRNYLMILRAFREIFPNTTVWYVPNTLNAFTIVIGRTEEGPIPLQRILANAGPAVAADLHGIDVHGVYDLASALLLDPEAVARITADIPPHVDDLPAVEYESGRIVDREAAWLRNFIMIARAMGPLGRAFGPQRNPTALAEAERIRILRAREHIEQLARAIRRER